jgi:hypothetical protein
MRLRTAAAVTLVSTAAGTLALLFAFFGVQAPQVDRARSMFDLRHYAGIYAAIAVIVLAGAGVFLTLRYLDRRVLAGGYDRRSR